MNTKLVHTNCRGGKSVFDAIEELKQSNLIPQQAGFGKRYYFGDEKNNPKIIGVVTVRKNEMFSIVV